MRVLPVIDLMDGLVVRGVAGKRSEYRPIVSPLVSDARPAMVAVAFVRSFAFQECYVADLDAIGGRQPNVDAWSAIAESGLALWLDAGVGTLERARDLWTSLSAHAGAKPKHRLIVGLESLASLADLQRIVQEFGAGQIVFSLDLKAGQLLTSNPVLAELSPQIIVEKAAAAGIKTLIILDLADVGVSGGTRTVELCRQLHREHPALDVVAGGGVRGLPDLRTLAAAGCSAALVASALHDGRLSAEDCRAIESCP